MFAADHQVLPLHPLYDAAAAQAPADMREYLSMLKQDGLQDLVFSLGYDDLRYVVLNADKEKADFILCSIPQNLRRTILTLFPAERIVAFLLEYSSVSECVLSISDCPLPLRNQIVSLLKKESKGIEILAVLPTVKESAGGLMSTELVRIQGQWTVGRCADEIRSQTERVKELYSLFVVNEQGILLGRVPLRRFLATMPKVVVGDLLSEQIVSVMAHDSPQEVAEVLEEYNFEALPVVNAKGQLLGRIRRRDVAAYLTEKEQQPEEKEKMADESILGMTKERLPWLLIGMCGGLLGAETMGLFENELSIVPALAFFVPLVMATGGNVGIQSSTLVIQALADKNTSGESPFKRVVKSGALAVVNGWFISLLVFAANVALFQNDFDMSMTVSMALFCVVLVASLIGTLLPILMKRLNINPALAAGPFITTANDLIGITVYFTVARMMYML